MLNPELISKTTEPIRISMGDLASEWLPEIHEVECNCEEKAVLRYQPHGISLHKTFTLYGEAVEVSNIPGYKCNKCGMVMFLPQIGDELFKRMKEAREKSLNKH